MKVVLFCGGEGIRMRGLDEPSSDGSATPKPLIKIGDKPLIWHVMMQYIQAGFKDFILAIGFQSEQFKSYFLSSNITSSGNVYFKSDGSIETFGNDFAGVSIRLIETGTNCNLGQRLLRVREFIDTDIFFANYADGLSDLNILDYLRQRDQNMVATLLAVKPSIQFHTVNYAINNLISNIGPPRELQSLRINAGFFIFLKAIFKYLNEGEELVEEPFARLAEKNLLMAYPYDGFWKNVDNLKDKRFIEKMYLDGEAVWLGKGNGKV